MRRSSKDTRRERLWIPIACIGSLAFTLSLAEEVVGGAPSVASWMTSKHEPGRCAMYGVCGDRLDGGTLNCPTNFDAPPAEPEAKRILQNICPDVWELSGGRLCCSGEQAQIMQQSMRMAEPFIIGCPACMHNFRNLFCTMFCSPDQSAFTNVTAVDEGSRASDRSKTNTVVKEVAFYLSEEFKNATFDSCKDVIFGSANSRAMQYIGNGATNAQEFLDFIGTVKDKTQYHVGSPFQIDFGPGDPDTAPAAISPWQQDLPTCWNSVLQCSCGDCPQAPLCKPPPIHTGPSSEHCVALHAFGQQLICSDAALLFLGLASLMVVVWAYCTGRLQSDDKGYVSVSSQDASLADRRSPAQQQSIQYSVELDAENSVNEMLYSQSRFSHPMSEEEWAAEAKEPGIQSLLKPVFMAIGKTVTSSPRWTILLSIAFVAFCMLGLIGIDVDTNPESLWVPPNSRASKDKESYERSFGPFYRIEQLILSTRLAADGARPSILTHKNLELVFDIHDLIDNIHVVTYDGDEVGLEDICFKPFADNCAIESIAQYWQLSRHSFDSGYPSLKQCLKHWSTDCRSAFRAPMDPKLVLGGYPENSTNYLSDTTALLITIPVNNDEATLHRAQEWEARFLELVSSKVSSMAAKLDLDLSWSAESSIQQELARESLLDVPTVAMSYVAMLAYISFALGKHPCSFARSFREQVVQSRVLLGFAGVAVVICSVLGGMGICSALGVAGSLIVMEVVPFLTLAIGVDNMFLIASEEAVQPRLLPVKERVVNALVSVGPSITLSTLCEVLAFLAASLTRVPAVRHFALVSAAAIALDFCLQITAFAAFLCMDCERMRDGRADILPCIRLLTQDSESLTDAFEVEEGSDDGVWPLHGADEADMMGNICDEQRSGVHAVLSSWLHDLHLNVLRKPAGKAMVLCISIILNVAALMSFSRISVGLDQQVALPQDSYLQNYFNDVLQFARVGPPLFFVVEGMNVSENSNDINAICGSASCNSDSLVNSIAQAARNPAETYIASPAASWIDDFLAWVQPELPNCCRTHKDGGFCPAPDVEPCQSHSSRCTECHTCLRESDLVHGRPDDDDFERLLPWFLEAKPSKSCAKGGQGVYNSLIEEDDHTGLPRGLADGTVTTAFRAMSAPLSSQRDFIAALAASRRLVDTVQQKVDYAHGSAGSSPFIYVYSVFHPFFEQFSTIISDSIYLVALSVMFVLLLTFGFTGSLHLSGIQAVAIASLLLDIMGTMPLCGIQLNAVSLVNISMSAGIGLEFLSHTGHAFLLAKGSRENRCAVALQGKGAAVCSGIILTKVVGVAMLAFSHTKIFDVYYFRMYLTLVVLGTFHGILLFPVLLALFGPKENDPPITVRTRSTNSDLQGQVHMYTTRARCVISRKDPSASGSSYMETPDDPQSWP